MASAICLSLAAAAFIGGVVATAARADSGLTGVRLKGSDGIYSIKVTTHRGDCTKHYKWMILVSGGRVSSVGGTPMDASGQISSRGVVALQFEMHRNLDFAQCISQPSESEFCCWPDCGRPLPELCKRSSRFGFSFLEERERTCTSCSQRSE